MFSPQTNIKEDGCQFSRLMCVTQITIKPVRPYRPWQGRRYHTTVLDITNETDNRQDRTLCRGPMMHFLETSWKCCVKMEGCITNSFVTSLSFAQDQTTLSLTSRLIRLYLQTSASCSSPRILTT